MSDIGIHVFVIVRTMLSRSLRRVGVDERGEGVISAAIAILIIAFIGALMWVAFKELFQSTADKTQQQIDKIGE